jgi:hypothetical protein
MADLQGGTRGDISGRLREATSPREPSRRYRKDDASPEGFVNQLGRVTAPPATASPVALLKDNLRKAKSGGQRGERRGKRYPYAPLVPRDLVTGDSHAARLGAQEIGKLALAQAKLAPSSRDQYADRVTLSRHPLSLSLAGPRPGVQSRSGGALIDSASIYDDLLPSRCRTFPPQGAVAIACQSNAATSMHTATHIGLCELDGLNVMGLS